MHQIEIPSKNVVIKFPSEIDEMTNQQFVRYLFYVLQYIDGNIDEQKFKYSLTILLLEIRRGFLHPFMSDDRIKEAEANLVRISELMSGFIEDEPQTGRREFKLKSHRNFVPRIRNYHGPRNGFENLTYCEYRVARGYFKAYAQDNNESDLNHLVAVLYRPAKFMWFFRKNLKSCDGEIRVPFNSKSNPLFLNRRVKRIAKVPFHIRYSVFIYFSACEDFLKTGRPMVDGNEIDLSKLYTTEGEGTGKADVGLVGLLFSLAETGVFGSIDQTDNTNLWDIMIRLYQVCMQMQEIEDKNRKI